MTLLKVNKIFSGYGKLNVLKNISFTVEKSEVVAVVGSNGAGKTTLLRTINGIAKSTSGDIVFDGEDITRLKTEKMSKLGLAHVPENRLCFPDLTVVENLELGAWSRGHRKRFDPVLELFPALKPRINQQAGTLSGGEQQMVAIGRALMSNPKLIILDEPSTGLAPIVVNEIMEALKSLTIEGTGILLVEQNVKSAFKIADRAIVLHRGELTSEGSPKELIANPDVRAAYLGNLSNTEPQ